VILLGEFRQRLGQLVEERRGRGLPGLVPGRRGGGEDVRDALLVLGRLDRDALPDALLELL
jgi:hypothetical protein